MAPPGEPPDGGKQFVYAGTPVEEVRVTVEGLQGPARAAALAAAEVARGAQTLGGLDELLRSPPVAKACAEAAKTGGEMTVEVSPGPTRGVIDVALRGTPLVPGTTVVSLQPGVDERTDSGIRFKVEKALPAADGGAPIQAGLGCSVYCRDAASAAVSLTPPALKNLGIVPSAEFAVDAANWTELCGPMQNAITGGLSLTDASGRHAVRFQAASRELLPSPAASPAVKKLPLASTKGSVGYRYLHDERTTVDGASIGTLGTASVEFAGLLGDVSLARFQGIYSYSRALLLGGNLNIAGTCGLAVPLLAGSPVPLEDRFFLGGTFGQGLGERFPGFAARGAGPSAARSAAAAAEGAGAVREKFRSVVAFGRGWETERRVEAVPVPPADEKAEVDPLGGCARASVSATAKWPLASVAGLRAFGFVSGAGGALLDEVRPTFVQDVSRSWRASASAGVAVALPEGGMLGVSYARALVARGGDQLRPWSVWLSFGPTL